MAFLATLRPMRLAHPAQRNKNREKGFKNFCAFMLTL